MLFGLLHKTYFFCYTHAKVKPHIKIFRILFSMYVLFAGFFLFPVLLRAQTPAPLSNLKQQNTEQANKKIQEVPSPSNNRKTNKQRNKQIKKAKKKLDAKYLSNNPFWVLNYEKEILLKRSDLQYLPLSSSVWHSLEKLYLPAVLLGAHSGGFNDIDSVFINSHGNSYRWQKYYLEGNDISSPLFAGQPLIDLSYYALDGIGIEQHNMSYAQRKGYRYLLRGQNDNSKAQEKDNVTADKNAFLHVSLPSSVGGVSFVIPHTMDREPAFDWGAPKKTRFYYPSFFAASGGNYLLKNKQQGTFYIDARVDNRKFIAIDKIETSFRLTGYYTLQLNSEQTVRVLYQGGYQPFLNAVWGLAKEQTMCAHQHAFAIQHTLNDEDFSHHSLFAYQLRSTRVNASQWQRSLENQIQYGKAQPPSDSHGFIFDHISSFKNFHFFSKTPRVKTDFFLPLNFSFRVDTFTIDNQVFAQTYKGIGYQVTLFSAQKPAFSLLLLTRPGFRFSRQGDIFDYEFNGGLAIEMSADQNSFHFVRIEPYASFSSTLHFKKGKWRLHASLAYEPIPFTSQDSLFLNDRSPSGQVRFWDDANHDGIYQKGEEKSVISNTGGAYHKSKAFLLGPSVQQLNFAVEKPLPAHWWLAFTAVGKIENNLLRVSYADDLENSFQLITHTQAPGKKVYERKNSFGQETFILSNQKQPGYFASLEIQVLKQKVDNRLALQFSVGTYFHLARTSFGNYPLGNDIGLYDEQDADPNSSLNNLGRTTYDRGYIIKFQYLWQISKHVFFSGIFHYRDGVPLAPVRVVEGLNQGNALLYNSQRGGGTVGVGRFSFFMDMDFRFLLQWPTWSLSFDVYNFFHLQLELYEKLVAGHHTRDPMEMIPPRMIRISANFQL